MKTSRTFSRRIAVFLVAALLLAPGLVWASEEELKESGAKAPATKSDKKDATESAKKDENAPTKIEFNTLEDISAFRGSLEQLWAATPESVPTEWREIECPEPPAPESAPLNKTKAP